MTKKVFICGASDCTQDSKYLGQSWHEKLAQQLSATYEIHNLAVPGASNFLIRLQIDRAVESGAQAIIIHFTSSVRTEITINHRQDPRPLLDRFYRHPGDNAATMLSLSRIQARHDLCLSKIQQQLLEQYQLEFFDLDCAVQKNYYLIHGALSELSNQNNIKFCFSLGGFEHPDFMTDPRSTYRDSLFKFQSWQSKENLWNYLTDWHTTKHNVVRPSTTGPQFHIIDPVITKKIADYYQHWVESI